MRAWYPHQGKILREKIQKSKYLNESMPGKSLREKLPKYKYLDEDMVSSPGKNLQRKK